jgi:hypothetical protein
MQRIARAGALAALLFAVEARAAEPKTLAVGDSLAPFELPDQHGKPHAVGASLRVLLLTRDMDGGGVVRAALAEQGDGASAFLSARGAVYVSDVSRMPASVRNIFALPAMRKRPYAVLVDEKGEATAGLPWEPAKASLFWLEDLRILRFELARTPEQVLELLGAAAKAPASP